MRIIVATSETQGARPGDVCEAEEGEVVVPVVCDGEHGDCSCARLMAGVRTGGDTTTAVVVESDMSREDYRRAIRVSEVSRGFAALGVSERVFNAQADSLLELAAQFASGTVIERDGEDFEARPAGAGARVV